VFGTKQLKDSAEKHVIVTAATVDRFEHRVFSDIAELSTVDRSLSAVDVALASSAAPTYFSPVKPTSQERTYVDGGVWANSPSLLALLVAHHYLGIPFSDIRLLSVGTGYFPEGRTFDEVNRLRYYSIGSVRTALELMWGCQASFVEEYAQTLIPPGHFHRIDVSLPKKLDFDDVRSAIDTPPPLAEKEAHLVAKRMRDEFFVSSELSTASQLEPPKHIPPRALVAELIPAAGLNAFYPSRKYYRTHREAATIDTYVATAQKSVVMISINLMTGVPFNGLCAAFRKKLNTDRDFTVVVSLLDPFQRSLMMALAPVLRTDAIKLAGTIQDSLREILALKDSLSESERKRLSVRVHRAIPFGSAILLDHREAHGRIQIESKVYKAHFDDSFAFEVAPTGSSGFYQTLAQGYQTLMDDGIEIDSSFLDREGADRV
jgi:hypothetical protein